MRKMSLREINKKLGSKQAKIQWSMQYNLLNVDSPLFCDKCKARLGVLYMVRNSLFKKKGAVYLVVCRSCKHINSRVKGDMGKKIDSDWDKYGF